MQSVYTADILLKPPSSLSIRQLLQIPPDQRTVHHCKEIIKHVKDVKFLEQYLYTDEIYDLAKEFRMQSFQDKEVIFRQGEHGDAYYIILSGSVKVFINIPSENKHFSNTKEIMSLNQGEAFGELALLYDSVRSATVSTTKPTDLIVLNKESFRKHIKDVKTTHLSAIIEFFKSFPGFRGLSQSEIAKLAGKSLMQRFSTNTVIVRQDDQPAEVYFVKSGKLKVIRRVDYKLNPSNKQIVYSALEGPSEEDYASGNFKSTLLEIDELSNGDSFCDSSIIRGETIHHTVVTTIPCELIYITAYDFKIMFDMPFFSQYEGLCKPYPEDSELRKLYLDMKMWSDFKRKMVNNVVVEKFNKRIGFQDILRSPVKKFDKVEQIGILQRDPSPPMRLPVKTQLLQPLTTYDNRISKSTDNLQRSRLAAKKEAMTLPRDSSHLVLTGLRSTTQNKSYYNYKFDFVKPLHKLKPQGKDEIDVSKSSKYNHSSDAEKGGEQVERNMNKNMASPKYSILGRMGSNIVSQSN